jgi:hypothetical protein
MDKIIHIYIYRCMSFVITLYYYPLTSYCIFFSLFPFFLSCLILFLYDQCIKKFHLLLHFYMGKYLFFFPSHNKYIYNLYIYFKKITIKKKNREIESREEEKGLQNKYILFQDFLYQIKLYIYAIYLINYFNWIYCIELNRLSIYRHPENKLKRVCIEKVRRSFFFTIIFFIFSINSFFKRRENECINKNNKTNRNE